MRTKSAARGQAPPPHRSRRRSRGLRGRPENRVANVCAGRLAPARDPCRPRSERHPHIVRGQVRPGVRDRRDAVRQRMREAASGPLGGQSGDNTGPIRRLVSRLASRGDTHRVMTVRGCSPEPLRSRSREPSGHPPDARREGRERPSREHGQPPLRAELAPAGRVGSGHRSEVAPPVTDVSPHGPRARRQMRREMGPAPSSRAAPKSLPGTLAAAQNPSPDPPYGRASRSRRRSRTPCGRRRERARASPDPRASRPLRAAPAVAPGGVGRRPHGARLRHASGRRARLGTRSPRRASTGPKTPSRAFSN